jgi:hypothetical protein
VIGWLAPIIWSLIVIIPIRIPSPQKDTGSPEEPEPFVAPEPLPVAVVGLVPAVETLPVVLVEKTIVTIVPGCGDDGSEKRLRMASLAYLSEVDNLPDDISFKVESCASEGMVDIEIVQVPKL